VDNKLPPKEEVIIPILKKKMDSSLSRSSSDTSQESLLPRSNSDTSQDSKIGTSQNTQLNNWGAKSAIERSDSNSSNDGVSHSQGSNIEGLFPSSQESLLPGSSANTSMEMELLTTSDAHGNISQMEDEEMEESIEFSIAYEDKNMSTPGKVDLAAFKLDGISPGNF
jgi:hypothetical protein